MGHFVKTSGSSRSSEPLIVLVALIPCLVLAVLPKPLNAAPQTSSQPPAQVESAPEVKPVAQKADSISQPPVDPEDPSEEDNSLGLQTLKNIVRDQRQIWTSPAHI